MPDVTSVAVVNEADTSDLLCRPRPQRGSMLVTYKDEPHLQRTM